ncbi:carboxymuconolactone decarboxylase family protein [Smaragdicoccus niigatensis]|uniref:carboxymuconolactone decarboxylase family protein n=1 Tax=Smaragdicoccus niigatensis TaxID=359359 RepID=UPI00038091C8|nr:carboxymuconolactone decarboxylase family protein [Smaragdicoccus niigatensis]
MRALKKMWKYTKVMAKAKRNRSDIFKWLIRRPLIGFAYFIYEVGLMFSNRMDPKLKQLAEMKAAAMVNCEFCIDIASALGNVSGMTEQQILDLPRYRDSDAYSDVEKLVISFAEAITRTPAINIEEIRDELLTHFTKGQVAELAAAIVWENQRARLNQALGVRPTGMAEGMVCMIPERPAQ